jgi:hypothetical protein
MRWRAGGSRSTSAAARAANAVRWHLSDRADPPANAVAKRHYNCQSPESDQWVKPGACLCFRTAEYGAIWSSSWPRAQYVKHAWAGAWENSTFRNERQDLYLSSSLIREGVAATLASWPEPPALGMVTMIDLSKTRRKRDPGRCYRKAGFAPVGYTQGGLLVLQLLPDAMPKPDPAIGAPVARLPEGVT